MSTTLDPQEADLARLRAMGFDPDLPDALDIGPGGVELLPRADNREVVTAQRFLDYIRETLGIAAADMAVHPWVIATFQRATFEGLIAATGAQPVPAWERLGRRVARGMVGQTPVTIARLDVGAPVAVTLLEELIASGGQRFLVLGTAGSLRPDLAVGSLILPTATLREEGTSFHYVPAGAEVAPDPELVEALASACAAQKLAVMRGPVWTTDAPYREIATKVQAYAATGILAVEMEAAALFAVAALRGVRLALLVAVSDHLGEVWRPAFLAPELRAAIARAMQVVIQCVAQDGTR